MKGDRNGVRVWHNSSGDGIGLYFYPMQPDVPYTKPVDELRGFYRNMAQTGGGAILEVDILTLDDSKVIRTVTKIPQKPTGMAYLGSLTLPFREFSYVLKIQCLESGMTGVRDSMILDELLKSGEVTVGEKGQLQGWIRDPYDSSATGAFARNRADSEEYDSRFPHHPLSRLRTVLAYVQKTLSVSDDVKRASI